MNLRAGTDLKTGADPTTGSGPGPGGAVGAGAAGGSPEPARVPTAHRFRGRRMIAVAFLSLAGAFGLNLAAGQFFAPLQDRYGWSLTSLSAAVAVNMLVWGLLQPVAGRLIDRFGPRIVMASSASLMGLAYLLLPAATEYWQFLVLFGGVTAVGFAGCSSMATSVLVARWYVAGRTRALLIATMGINAGQLLLLPLTGFLIDGVGDRAAFLTLGGVMVLLIVPAITLFTRNSPGEVGEHPDGRRPAGGAAPVGLPLTVALRDREFWLTTLSFGTCGYSLYLIITHLPKYAIELGGAPGTGGQLMAVVAAGSAASMFVLTRYAGRWSRSRALLALHLIRTVAFVGLAFAGSTGHLFLWAAVFGISSFPVIPQATAIIATRFGATAMGGILGSTWLVHQLFAAVGVFGGGLLRSASGSYGSAFASGALVLLGGAVLTLLIRESAPRPTPALANP